MNLLTIAALLVLVVACGGGAAAPTATPPPATPTPFVAPTALGNLSEVSATHAELLNLGPLKDLPAELAPDAARLPAAEVQQIWTDWVADTAFLSGDDYFFVFCRDGTGTFIYSRPYPIFDGQLYSWNVYKSSATVWNVATGGFTDNVLLESIALDLDPTGLAGDIQGDISVFEYPSCGQ